MRKVINLKLATDKFKIDAIAHVFYAYNWTINAKCLKTLVVKK